MAGLVDEPEHYRYSSARNHAEMKGLLEVTLIEWQLPAHRSRKTVCRQDWLLLDRSQQVCLCKRHA